VEAAELSMQQILSILEESLWLEAQLHLLGSSGKSLERSFLMHLSAELHEMFPFSLRYKEILGAAKRYELIDSKEADSLAHLFEVLHPTLHQLFAVDEGKWDTIEIIAVKLLQWDRHCLENLRSRLPELRNILADS
jgi:hypothetical protein